MVMQGPLRVGFCAVMLTRLYWAVGFLLFPDLLRKAEVQCNVWRCAGEARGLVFWAQRKRQLPHITIYLLALGPLTTPIN